MAVAPSSLFKKATTGYMNAPSKLEQGMKVLGENESAILKYGNILHLQSVGASAERVAAAREHGVLLKSGDGCGICMFAPEVEILHLQDSAAAAMRTHARKYAASHLDLGEWASCLDGPASGKWDSAKWACFVSRAPVLNVGFYNNDGLSSDQRKKMAAHKKQCAKGSVDVSAPKKRKR